MKLYQINNGHIITDPNITEIGATADGWKRADQNPRPTNFDFVDVVLRNGIHFENAPTSSLSWNLDGTEDDVVAFRIVPTYIQLEVGGIYKARDGIICGPLKAHAHANIYTITDGKWTWTTTGGYYTTNDRHPRDLVEKIAQVPADTASEWVLWGKTGQPNISADSLVEIVSRSGKLWIGSEAQRTNQWTWSAHVLAYRVVPPAKAKPTFQLEVGGIYKSRDGEIYGPLKAHAHADIYTFTDTNWAWMSDGGYFRTSPNHPRDLVDLIAHVPTETASEWITWNKNAKPSLPNDTIVEVVTRSGKVQTGNNAQPVHKWFWTSHEGATPPYTILAYRVVPQPTPKLTIEERLARLEAKIA